MSNGDDDSDNKNRESHDKSWYEKTGEDLTRMWDNILPDSVNEWFDEMIDNATRGPKDDSDDDD